MLVRITVPMVVLADGTELAQGDVRDTDEVPELKTAVAAGVAEPADGAFQRTSAKGGVVEK